MSGLSEVMNKIKSQKSSDAETKKAEIEAKQKEADEKQKELEALRKEVEEESENKSDDEDDINDDESDDEDEEVEEGEHVEVPEIEHKDAKQDPVVEIKPIVEPVKEESKPESTKEHEIEMQKAKEVEMLQNDGIFRAESLYQLSQLNQHLMVLNTLINKAIGGDDAKKEGK